MILKKELYPSTKRIPEDGCTVTLTEKMDGSNLAIFKKDGVLFIAQRNTVFSIDELENVKDILYRGLYAWLKQHKDYFIENVYERSVICGEWLVKGHIVYPEELFEKRYYMFAKANVDDEFRFYNFIYEQDKFIYPFNNQVIPDFFNVVPIVKELKQFPTKEVLDKIYEEYRALVNRPVEGFVVNMNNMITKYVRMKQGKVVEYRQDDHKSM